MPPPPPTSIAIQTAAQEDQRSHTNHTLQTTYPDLTLSVTKDRLRPTFRSEGPSTRTVNMVTTTDIIHLFLIIIPILPYLESPLQVDGQGSTAMVVLKQQV